MKIELKDELAKFVETTVRAGEYASAEEAVNAAVARMRAEDESLDDELSEAEVRSIETGLAELSRGEGVPWQTVREQLLKRVNAES